MSGIAAIIGSLVFVSPAGAGAAKHSGPAIGTPVATGLSDAIVRLSPDRSRLLVAGSASPPRAVILDPTTNAVVGRFSIPAAPDDAVFSPDDTRIYSADAFRGTVSVINAANGGLIAQIPVSQDQYNKSIAIAPDGRHVYVTNDYDDDVTVIDTATNTVSSVIHLGTGGGGEQGLSGSTRDVAVSPDSRRIYVTLPQDDELAVIDTSTNAVTATVDAGDYPEFLVLSPDGLHAYIANVGDGSSSPPMLSVFDTSSDTVTGTIPMSNEQTPASRYIALGADGTHVYWIGNRGGADAISILDLPEMRIVRTLTGGDDLYSVGTGPDSKRIYVTDDGYGTASVVPVG